MFAQRREGVHMAWGVGQGVFTLLLLPSLLLWAPCMDPGMLEPC